MGYFGSKTASGAGQAIIAQMPPHDLYVETHLGSAAVLLMKPPAAKSMGVERNFVAADVARASVERAKIPACSVYTGDYAEQLEGVDWARAGQVLVYADPPYVIATRTSDKRYPYDYTDADHVRLVAWLRRLPANVKVILSGYPSALYDRLLPDWRTVEFQVMTRGGPRTEKLWMNFPEGEVQWATFAGVNRTDRQRIKRKAARWATMYGQLSAGERLAVLAALLKVHARDLAQLEASTPESDVDAGDYPRACVDRA